MSTVQDRRRFLHAAAAVLGAMPLPLATPRR